MAGFKPPKRHSSKRDSRVTPPELYAALDAEFGPFTLDPCPLDTSSIAGASLWGKDGLRGDWCGHRVFCNPPYTDIGPWLAKATEALVAVYLLPVRSDCPWWHDYALHANELRFIRGRLRFGGMSGGAPFPSVVVVFDHTDRTRWTSMDRPQRSEIEDVGRPQP